MPGDVFRSYYDDAHNDFLELWVEGGTIALVLAGMAIGLIVFKGIRAVRCQPLSPNGRLALGGLIGFIAVVVHSFVDFGLHIPAVSLFTAIVAAMLVNLSEQAEPRRLHPLDSAHGGAGLHACCKPAPCWRSPSC